MKNRINTLYKKMLPKPFRLGIYNARKRIFKFFDKRTKIKKKYEKKLIDTYGFKVIGGPFAGMNYVDEAVGSSYVTKLIGCYEEPLHRIIEEIKKDEFDTIIDIGTAEGYYLIGLGKFFPNANLIGYDINPKALDLVRKLAKANDLKNKLLLDNECTFKKLNEQITDKTLLICDAEGFEKVILNPEQAPGLLRVKTMIVEMHDHKIPGVRQSLTKAFEYSHSIEYIHLTRAKVSNYPFLQRQVKEKDLSIILNERTTQNQYTAIFRRLNK